MLVNGVKSQGQKLFATSVGNAGEESAMKGWFDGQEAFSRNLKTASGAIGGVNKWLNDQAGKSNDTKYSYSGCPADWKKYFPPLTTDYPVYMLSQTAASQNVVDDYIPLLRGLVGDVYMVTHKTTDEIMVGVEPPCKENYGLTLADFLEGSVWVHKGAGACEKMDQTEAKKLKKWAKDNNDKIHEAMKGKTALAADVVNYINAQPVAVHYALRMAVASGQYDVVSEELAKVSATQYLIKVVGELYQNVGRMRKVLQEAEKVASVSSGGECEVGDLLEQWEKQAPLFYSQADKSVANLQKAGQQAIRGFSESLVVSQNLATSMQQVEAKVAQAFGPAVAARVAAKVVRR